MASFVLTPRAPDKPDGLLGAQLTPTTAFFTTTTPCRRHARSLPLWGKAGTFDLGFRDLPQLVPDLPTLHPNLRPSASTSSSRPGPSLRTLPGGSVVHEESQLRSYKAPFWGPPGLRPPGRLLSRFWASVSLHYRLTIGVADGASFTHLREASYRGAERTKETESGERCLVHQRRRHTGDTR